MRTLETDWFINGTIDFEYKKYVLLAYLQNVRAAFSEKALYPFLGDLVAHYRTLKQFKEGKRELKGRFPRNISHIDLSTQQIHYAPALPDDEKLEEVEQIVDFSLPQIEGQLEAGRQIYDWIDNQIDIEPIGLVPLYLDAGYLLLRKGTIRELKAFEYQVSVFQEAEDKFRSLSVRYVGSFETSLTQTPEAIKRGLIAKNQSMPNPATYLIFSPHIFPEQATLLPVAKRKFIRFLAVSA